MIDGLVLSGGRPASSRPSTTTSWAWPTGSRPRRSAAALARSPDIGAAFIVSPTYYGMAADVAAAPRWRTPPARALVVDCAWGSHFGFHPALPESPLGSGADAMLASTHKIVGSLTQSAMLHVARDGLIDPDEVARCGPAGPLDQPQFAAAGLA